LGSSLLLFELSSVESFALFSFESFEFNEDFSAVLAFKASSIRCLLFLRKITARIMPRTTNRSDTDTITTHIQAGILFLGLTFSKSLNKFSRSF
ncbi:hypothetical protein CP02DC21_1746, partial [Chlamydia psittaci 02DC21]